MKEERENSKFEAELISEQGHRSPSPEPPNLKVQKSESNKNRSSSRSKSAEKLDRKRRSKKRKNGRSKSEDKKLTSPRLSTDSDANSKDRHGSADKWGEEPMVTMDRMFSKTTALPAIYWLPLSKEQRRVRKRKLEKEKEKKNMKENMKPGVVEEGRGRRKKKKINS